MLRRLMVLVHACRRLGGRRLGRGRWLPLLFACLTTLSACSSDVNILTVTSESDANEVMSSLLNNGITPSRSTTKTGIVIAVPSSAMANALEVLRQAGLPRERFEGLGKTFQKEGMISSPVEERALYVHALSQELANTLSKIDGVVVARVHLVLPEAAGVDRVATPAKAGVFIKYHADQPLDAVLPQLRTMITHAIPGLTADNVSVALVPATTGKEPVKPTPGKDIMGVTVAPESVAKMEFIIGGLLLAALVSIGAGGLFWWRHGRGRTEARQDKNSGKGKDGGAGKTATPASGNQDREASRV